MSRIIRSTIEKKISPADAVNATKDFESTGALLTTNHRTNQGASVATSRSSPPITLHFNIVQSGKRILPRLDVPPEHCPDLQTARQLLARHFAGQLPDVLASSYDEATGAWDPSVWRFKVWLPEGLVMVDDDGEWTIAQLSTSSVDWMDGHLRVVLEV
jgi:hypothetical protein